MIFVQQLYGLNIKTRVAENLELSDFKKCIIMDCWDRKLTEIIDEELIKKKKQQQLYLRKIYK